MNRTLKITVIVCVILGVVVGCTLGIRAGIEFGKLQELFEPFTTRQAVAEFATMQFHRAESNQARKALLFLIHYVKDADRFEPGSWGTLWVAYTRLGIVEEAAGNPAAAHAAFDQARLYLLQSPTKHPSDANLSDSELKDHLKLAEQRWKEVLQKSQKLQQDTAPQPH
jgi:hypothetical protein